MVTIDKLDMLSDKLRTVSSEVHDMLMRFIAEELLSLPLMGVKDVATIERLAMAVTNIQLLITGNLFRFGDVNILLSTMKLSLDVRKGAILDEMGRSTERKDHGDSGEGKDQQDHCEGSAEGEDTATEKTD
jgi:hypothetical protein